MGRIFGRKRQTPRSKSVGGGPQLPSQSSSSGSNGGGSPQSVHRRNVHLFAQPIILAFNIVRFVAFQLWILLSIACRVTSRAIENCDDNVLMSAAAVGSSKPSLTLCSPAGGGSGVLTLTGSQGSRLYTGRPAEPIVSQQKHHHRKAFEYISKALKLDEEDKGQYSTCRYECSGRFVST